MIFVLNLRYNSCHFRYLMMKKAVVMGASSGIGREVARLLLQQGWKVGLAARHIEPLKELASEFLQQVDYEQVDITEDGAEKKLLQLVNRIGGMTLYFHASGIGKQNPLLAADIELSTAKTNVEGFSRMVGAAFRYFQESISPEQEAHIAVISSIAGTKGLGPAPAYSATKAFQGVYIEALEQLAENRGLPIRFTDIRPGFVDTPLLAGQNYPMLMDEKRVARSIVKAVGRHRHVVVVDWRYRVLVFFWRLIPRWLWRRLPITRKIDGKIPENGEK